MFKRGHNVRPLAAGAQKKPGLDRVKLKHKHAYYTQVQLEMAVTGRPWIDFVVFTSLDEDEGKDTDIFIERIYFSSSFWENKLLLAAKAVFSKYVVLELLTC